MTENTYVTAYIAIIHKMTYELHQAYPNQQIELRIHEESPNSWQCYIELSEQGAKLATESFHINPPGV